MATFLSATSGVAMGATRCVNPGGTGGCFASINAAVASASSNDTIRVAAGTYHEDVVVPKPLSIVGAAPDGALSMQPDSPMDSMWMAIIIRA